MVTNTWNIHICKAYLVLENLKELDRAFRRRHNVPRLASTHSMKYPSFPHLLCAARDPSVRVAVAFARLPGNGAELPPE